MRLGQNHPRTSAPAQRTPRYPPHLRNVVCPCGLPSRARASSGPTARSATRDAVERKARGGHAAERFFKKLRSAAVTQRRNFLKEEAGRGASVLSGTAMGRHPGADVADLVLQLEIDDPAPAYIQLERRVRLAIADGTLQPG